MEGADIQRSTIRLDGNNGLKDIYQLIFRSIILFSNQNIKYFLRK